MSSLRAPLPPELLGALVEKARAATLGSLLPDVCHEIMNQLAFVLSNLQHLDAYNEDTKQIVGAFRARLTATGGWDDILTRMEKELDFDFVLDDAGRAAREALVGAQRIRDLVSTLRSAESAAAPRVATAAPGTQPPGTRELVDVPRVVRQAVELMEKAISRTANLTIEAPTTLYAVGSRGGVVQILIELLRNSVEAQSLVTAVHAPLGLARTRELGNVMIAVGSQEERITVTVRDDGPGVPVDNVELLFEPLFTTKPSPALGLGLATARKLALGFGGDLTYDGKGLSGRGASFTILVPAV